MGLQKILVLCAILLALGVSGWYFLQEKNDRESSAEAQSAIEEQAEDDDSRAFTGRGSFAELMALGASYTCDFRAENTDGVSEGTVYFDGGGERYMMEAHYESEDGEGSFGSITEGDSLYWWGDTPEGRMGMHMTVREEDDASTAPEAYTEGQGATVSADEEVAYSCEPWRVDAAVFSPPSDVDFTDMDEMMQGMFEGLPEGFEVPANMQHMGH